MQKQAFIFQYFQRPGVVDLPGGLAFLRSLAVGLRLAGFQVRWAMPSAASPPPPGSVVFFLAPGRPGLDLVDAWSRIGLTSFWVNTSCFPRPLVPVQRDLWSENDDSASKEAPAVEEQLI